MKDEVIQINVSKNIFRDGVLVTQDEQHWNIKPENPVPENISKINGITNDMLADANDIEAVMAVIYEYMGLNPCILGWNVKDFTIPFLKNAGFNSGYMIDVDRYIDVLYLSKSLIQSSSSFKSYSYKSVLTHLGLKKDTVKTEGYVTIFNLLFDKIPSGCEKAEIKDIKYWKKSNAVQFLFLETDCGKISLNCNSAFWCEQTPGFFDSVDLDDLTMKICRIGNSENIWDCIKAIVKEKTSA